MERTGSARGRHEQYYANLHRIGFILIALSLSLAKALKKWKLDCEWAMECECYL